MNIFWLDNHPKLAAAYHCDKHVVKMILESAQILCTVHHLYKDPVSPIFYKPTHQSHPCTIWTSKNDKNYLWTWCLFYWLSKEYYARYRKIHKTTKKLLQLTQHPPQGIKIVSKNTEPVQAMPMQYKHKDPVVAYRQYYIGEKKRFAQWKYSETPRWWITGELTL